MNKKLLAELKKELTKKKASIMNKMNSKNVTTGDIEIGDEVDTALQSIEREMDFELGGIDTRMIKDIDHAIAKINKGTFGVCECCDEKISDERLKAIPWGRYCKKCQEDAEKNS